MRADIFDGHRPSLEHLRGSDLHVRNDMATGEDVMFIEDDAAPLALIVLADDMHEGGRNLTMNEPPPESLRQPEEPLLSQLG